MQEGMCKNCGSIVYVDPKQENCHCLFCDCVFPSQEALEIKKNPDKYEFLNEEQPKFTGEEINPQQTKINTNLDQLVEKKTKKTKAKPKPKYNVEKKALPDINLSRKQILSLVGIVIAITALFLVIMLPQTVNRDQQRAKITEQFKMELSDEVYKESLDFDNGFSISRLKNSHVELITDNNFTKEDARHIFETYCMIRADVMDISLTDQEKAYNSVTLKISIPEEGGFLVEDKNSNDLESLAAIVELP